MPFLTSPFRSGAREQAPVVPGAPRKTGQGLRNMELGLLVFAFIINFSALLLVQLGVRGTFDFNVVTLSAIIGALTLGVNIVLRFRAPGADPFILPIAAVLNGLGIAMIYRIDLSNPNLEGVFWTPSTQQIVLTMLAVGVAMVVLILLKNHRVLQRYTYVFMAIAIVLLLLPLIPGLGRTDVAARVWISIAGFSFQPGEIAKIALAIFFAGYLVTARDSLSVVGKKFLWMRFPRIRDLGPILVVWAVCMGVLVFQRDLGTSLLYFGLFLVMVFVSTGRLSWVLIGLGLFIGGALIAANTLGYVEFRVHAWLDPFDQEMYEADGGSFQLVTGLFGLGAGGLIGKGLGSGSPGTTPLASSDFIIAAIGEELGMAGIFVVLLLFVIFVARGFRIGQQGVDDFGRLLATGLAFTIALQVFVVAGGVMRVIPLTGLTMPFMAAGGSSLLANWIIVAILLRLSDTVRNVPTEAIDE
ncbi:FtsW/RodA/SpoVE family cell cycle protein [Pseudoclavibacter helvolus]|uniref:FtsW/RodA/SpoVE family cell cycle protein n=1 Tax=Pseudoclavibacter helvolus TaxID=255205 RepID=UPI0037356364